MKNLSTLAISVIWLVIGLVITTTDIPDSQIYHNILVLYSFASYILCMFNWAKSGNRLFSVYIIFIAYAMFSNLGQSILSLFPELDVVLLIYNVYSQSALIEMLKFQCLCVAALNLGSVFYLRNADNNISTEYLQNYYTNVNKNSSSRKTGLDVLLWISLLYMVYIAGRQLILKQTMSYSEVYANRQVANIYLGFCSVGLGMYYILKKWNVRSIICIWAFLLFAFFAAGTRSQGIVYFGALIVSLSLAFPRFTQKKYLPVWGVASFFGMAILSAISASRQSSGFAQGIEGSWLLGFLASIQEMGSSSRTIIATMQEVDSTGNYFQTILYAVMEFFLPADIVNMILPDTASIAPGTWINTLHNENNEWGFSFISEAYLNYGKLGWIFMLFYGYIIAYMENISFKKYITSNNCIYALLFLPVLCRLIFYARGQMQLTVDFARPAFYAFVLLMIIKKGKL